MDKKFILFDHDGVLVETEYWYFRSNQKALSELGIELSKEQHIEYMKEGYSFWDIDAVKEMDPQTVSAKRTDRDRYYQSYLQSEDIEIPNVEPVLEKLSNHYRMAIVTTSRTEDFRLIHQNRTITSWMEFVLSRNDYDQAKPHPEPYLTALNRFGATKEEALVIEDSERGLRSAVAAGIDCAIDYNEFTQSHDFSSAQYRIPSLNELPDLLGLKSDGPAE